VKVRWVYLLSIRCFNSLQYRVGHTFCFITEIIRRMKKIVLAHKVRVGSALLFSGQLKIPGDLPHQSTREAKCFGNFSAPIIRK